MSTSARGTRIIRAATSSASNLTRRPPSTYDEIADQLVNGYWGGDDHHFNVSPGGSLTVNITALTAAGQNLARQALALWSDVIGVTFREVTTGGQITFDDNEEGAHAEANWANGIISSAHVNVSAQWLRNYGTSLVTYSFQTYVHEIGHALGLGHGGHYNGDADYFSDALFANDAWSTTVMSYFDQRDNSYFADQGFTRAFAVTPMISDVIAMSILYGSSTTTRTGDTTYGFNTNAGRAVFNASTYPNVAYTVVDSGGTDTLDYSGFTAAQLINLEPESFSNVGGRTGNVAIARGTTIENAIGGSGNDQIRGNSAANSLEGRAGNDALYGFAGNDFLVGGPGDDRRAGGTGIDTASYASARDAVRIDLAAQSAQSIGASDAAGIGVDTLTEVENAIGSAYADRITGNGVANRLEGRAGNDVIDGGGGADVMIGGTGDDLYYVDSSRDSAAEVAGQGTDHVRSTVTYRLGANVERLTLLGTSTINGTGNGIANLLYGNAAANALFGLGDADVLYGYASNDRLDGGLDVDKMYGGLGNDVYYVDSGSDAAIELADEGTDTVYSTVSYALRANVERLTLTGTANLRGFGNELANRINGNSGANNLYGRDGNDLLFGYASNDRLNGEAGADRMYGGTGNDIYYVDNTSDVTYEKPGEGLDRVFSSVSYALRADLEHLTLTGTGNIAGKGNELANIISGNAGANSLYGYAGNDRLLGRDGNDLLYGGLDNDRLEGGAGDDRLYGEDGPDVLYGGDGADVLHGGAGRDRMYGGAGSDKFMFDDGHIVGGTNSAADVIHDFSQSQGDIIDLRRVDANADLTGDQNFAFIGTAEFSGTAGELRYEQVSSYTFVYGDTNGDGVADFAIRLDGLHTLAPTDFVF